LAVLKNGKSAWESFDEFLPFILNDSEFLLFSIILHVYDALELVADCEVLYQ
jgi:hypothetical protein